ncbi:MAG: hypothetical protein M3Q03_06380 [Chloroflexota bacterium]|nr:hypothetical protein [Chloroflexota bacterium]
MDTTVRCMSSVVFGSEFLDLAPRTVLTPLLLYDHRSLLTTLANENHHLIKDFDGPSWPVEAWAADKRDT